MFEGSFIILYNAVFTTPPILTTAVLDKPPKKQKPILIDPYLLNRRRLRKASSEFFDRTSSSSSSSSSSIPNFHTFRPRAQSLMVVMNKLKPKDVTQSMGQKSTWTTVPHVTAPKGRKKTKKRAKFINSNPYCGSSPYFLPRLTPLGIASNLLKGICASAALVLFTLGEPKSCITHFIYAFSHN